MKITEQKMKACDFIDLIDNRLENITMKYHHAVANKNKVSAECLAESKWQIAELKMQLCDLLIENMSNPTQE